MAPPLICAIWIAWGAYWLLVSRNVKSSRRIESIPSRLAHSVPLMVAALLIAPAALPGNFLRAQILPWPCGACAIGVALMLAGFAFTVWARVTLGRNWSGMVTLKHDHELIRSGPYAIVRHPIYTGILAMYSAAPSPATSGASCWRC